MTGEDLAGRGKGGKNEKKQQKASDKGASGEGASQKEDVKREVKKVTRWVILTNFVSHVGAFISFS